MEYVSKGKASKSAAAYHSWSAKHVFRFVWVKIQRAIKKFRFKAVQSRSGMSVMQNHLKHLDNYPTASSGWIDSVGRLLFLLLREFRNFLLHFYDQQESSTLLRDRSCKTRTRDQDCSVGARVFPMLLPACYCLYWLRMATQIDSPVESNSNQLWVLNDYSGFWQT